MARLVALFCAVLLAFGGAAQAEEKINRFEVDLEVERDADIIVTETITVTAEHQAINRGIFRDLPRYYRYEDGRTSICPMTTRSSALRGMAARSPMRPKGSAMPTGSASAIPM